MGKKIQSIISKYKSFPVTAKATLWFIFCGTLQKGMAFITTPIFTRLLTTEQYGQYTAYNSWLSIFTMITTFNLTYAVFNKGLSKYSEDKDGYTSAMMTTTSIITIACLGLYLVFHNQIDGLTELSTTVTVLMFVELLFYPSVSFWMLRQRYDFKYTSVVIVTLLMSLINAVAGIIAVVVSEDKGIARIMSCILVNIIFGAIIYVKIYKKGKKIFVWEYTKFAVIFNIPLIPHYLSTYILDQSDRIMIQKMCGMQYVGIYGVAYSLGMVMKIITSSVNQSLTPWEYRKLKEGDFRSINKQFVSIMAFVGVLLIVFMAVAPEAMRILASEKYYEAVYIVPSVTSAVFFMLAYGIFSNVEFYFDANKFTMVVSALGAITNVVLNFIFIRLYGYIMAGYTTLVCYIIFTAAHFIYAQYVAKQATGECVFEGKSILILSVIMGISSIVMTVLYHYTLIRYGVFIGLISISIISKDKIKKTVEAILKK